MFLRACKHNAIVLVVTQIYFSQNVYDHKFINNNTVPVLILRYLVDILEVKLSSLHCLQGALYENHPYCLTNLRRIRVPLYT